MFQNRLSKCAVLGSALLVASMPVHAALTVDFSSVITDIGTVSTAVIGVLVAFKGVTYVWHAIRRA